MSGEPQDPEHRRRRTEGGRTLAVVASLLVHVLILLVMFPPRVDTPPLVESPAMVVSLVEGPPQALGPAPPGPAAPAAPAPPAAKPTPPKPPKTPRAVVKPLPPRPNSRPVPVDDEEPAAPPAPVPSDAQLASAQTAGSSSGSGGGAGDSGGRTCDMVRLLQNQLRGDAMVQAAVAQAHQRVGPVKAMWLWNGDWIRSAGEDGKGLAVVRQAVMWEVAFAPAACRAEPMHGLVMISLNDGPGSPRLVIGSGAWRWGELLFPPKS